jgi:fatty acid desaturase
MRIATLIDVDALLHVALYSLVGAVGLVTAYGTAVLALDRFERPTARGGARAAWTLTIVLAAAVCVALLAAGFWAMTQKS